MQQCDVSVVIPAYNAEAFIVDALESIFRQTILPKDVIVINDGSTDKTHQVIQNWIATTNRSCPVHLLTQVNHGLPATRNIGIKRASGKWIALLDADDIWEVSHLEQLLSAVHYMPTAIAAYGAGRLLVNGKVEALLYDDFWDNPSKKHGQKIENTDCLAIDFRIFPRLIQGNFIKPSSLMISKSSAEDVGLFNEALRSAEDREFLVRLIRKGDFVYSPTPITQYRWHDDNATQGKHAKRNMENGLWALQVIRYNHSLNLNLAEKAICDAEVQSSTKEYLYLCSGGARHYLLGLKFIRLQFGILAMLNAVFFKHIWRCLFMAKN